MDQRTQPRILSSVFFVISTALVREASSVVMGLHWLGKQQMSVTSPDCIPESFHESVFVFGFLFYTRATWRSLNPTRHPSLVFS